MKGNPGGRPKILIAPATLEQRYWGDGMTVRELAQSYGVSTFCIYARMDEAGIPRRPKSQKNDEWAWNWRKCRECGTTKIPHHALGFCKKCYGRVIEYPRFRRRQGLPTSKREWREPQYIKDNAANCPDFGSLYCANECDAKLEFADQIEGIDFCDPDNCIDCAYSEPCPCFDEEKWWK